MLGFHKSIVEEVAQQDGLVVMAAGLGMHKVIAAILTAHIRNPENREKVVLLLSVNPEQRQVLQEELRLQHELTIKNPPPDPPQTSEQPATQAPDSTPNPEPFQGVTPQPGEASQSGSPLLAGPATSTPPATTASSTPPLGSLALSVPPQTAPLLREVDNQFSSHERLALYRGGGCLFVTSRILIVDLLNERVPLGQVSGIVVCNAHRVTETCAEAFIMRLFRAGNKRGFIRAFTDRPQAVASGFNKVERIMKSLFLKRLYLWPRFQMQVSSALEASPPEVVDIRMPLSPAMVAIQEAIIQVMDACMKELKKINKLDVEDLTVENGLFKSFDEIVRRQLDPIWHTIGRKTKQLVADLKTLRKLAEFLLRYDAVTFLRYLDTLRLSEGIRSVWLFAEPTHKIFEYAKRRVYHAVKTGPDGLAVQPAQKRGPVAASVAKKRKGPGGQPAAVQGLGNANGAAAGAAAEGVPTKVELEVVLEEMPKWRILREILEEIQEEKEELAKQRALAAVAAMETQERTAQSPAPDPLEVGPSSRDPAGRLADSDFATSGGFVRTTPPFVNEDDGPVLVAAKDERMCLQLEACIVHGGGAVMRAEWDRFLLAKAEVHKARQKGKKKAGGVEQQAANGQPGPSNAAAKAPAGASGTGEQEALLAAAKKVFSRGGSDALTIPESGFEEERGSKAWGRGRGKGKAGNKSGSEGSGGDSESGGKEGGRGRGRVKGNRGRGRGAAGEKGQRTLTQIGRKESGGQGEAVLDERGKEKAGEETGGDEDVVEVDGSTFRARQGTGSGRVNSVVSETALDSTGGTAKNGDQGDGEPDRKGKRKAEPEVAPSLRKGAKRRRKALPAVHFYALESEQQVLEVVRPAYVIVHDPDMAFVRELELYKAEHPERSLKVYFLLYEQSTEERKFESSIQRENAAFEALIKQKAIMTVPVDQDGRLAGTAAPQSATGVTFSTSGPGGTGISTRKAGGRQKDRAMQVVVDMREFNSSLPSVLHQQGMKIVPVTLEVGDYILSPEVCVERKSLADLFQSFGSGRLYNQAEAMTRYYKTPVLLIEFDQDKSFSLQSAGELTDDIFGTNIISKLSLLVLHFPRLRIIWSRSVHATADIFAALKANQEEPDVKKAMVVGVPTEDGVIEGDRQGETYNTTAQEVLRRLPGVTDANYRMLMDGVKCLADLAETSIEDLSKLMDGQRPAKMLREFLDAKCPTV
ncbi:Structure-specific endonuclease ERCC1-XPF [Klebsormidium nitens]|uniref:Structure-specific endonuclease ERCC1-XPF n=1 Tax=Klebsormidium nitens TaxID=105231 RepID=A0A1Y1I3K2_KLENI|nr:Structure-specific endonuclease ERCC1-XPF [Klebsormidium nitens]|eukprot:GAQ83327.1 Structure-specific endonuclease ERCC1-XPF [Klebsormidium nitens]